MGYTKALHIRKDRNGNNIVFISKFISTIDIPYQNYYLIK